MPKKTLQIVQKIDNATVDLCIAVEFITNLCIPNFSLTSTTQKPSSNTSVGRMVENEKVITKHLNNVATDFMTIGLENKTVTNSTPGRS